MVRGRDRSRLHTVRRAGKCGAAETVEVLFFSSRRRHTRCSRDWSSDVCSSDLRPPWRILCSIASTWCAGRATSSTATSPRSPEPAATRLRPTRLPPASGGRRIRAMPARRLYITVALCGVVVYLGALWNQFALDDVPIIVVNPLVAHPSGLWRAFAAPYWAPELGGHMYRPLVIAGFALDALVDGTVWFHAVNLLWHAGAAVAVAALARRWMDTPGGMVAGLLFAVHPVHVEAVANVVGRAELMAGG